MPSMLNTRSIRNEPARIRLKTWPEACGNRNQRVAQRVDENDAAFGSPLANAVRT